MFNLFRWICFFLFKPVDYLVLALEWVYYPFFYFFVIDRKRLPKREIRLTRSQIIAGAKAEIPDSNGFVSNDEHTLICELGNGLINKHLRKDLIEKMVTSKGSLLRRFPDNQVDPSLDCLASWAAAYVLWKIDNPELLKKVAIPFLKNCFALEWQKYGGAGRSSSSGIMPAYGLFPSGKKWWKLTWGLAQPMASTSFYSTLGFLGLLRAKLGFIWSVVYWAYYLINLGPLRRFTPMLYTRSNTGYYLHHILAMNFWVLNKTVGGFKSQLKYVSKTISPNGSMQPWIAGFAVDAGALSENDRLLAMNTLLSINGAQSWPQYKVSSGNFHAGSSTGWTNMYLALTLLSK